MTHWITHHNCGTPKNNREMMQEGLGRLVIAAWIVVTALGFLADAMAGQTVKMPSAKTLKVIYQAAKRYDVDAQALIKIAYLESSFKADARRVNVNGTVDFGMFQVNSVHWTTTCKGLDVFSLKGNASCAAKLLSLAAKHADVDPHWTGRYHSKTPTLKAAYAAKLASITLSERY